MPNTTADGTNLRRSTIYDYSSLRLHHDGTRVQQTDGNYSVPHRKQLSVRDAHGSWIAADAAGLVKVRRIIKAKRPRIEEGGEVVDLGVHEDEDEEGMEYKEDSGGQQKKRKRGWFKFDRKAKNKGFEENLDFLDKTLDDPANVTTAGFPSTSEEDPCLPIPPSDLLKSIHYSAASFYTQRGELWNAAKLYRQERNNKTGKKKKKKKRKRRRVEDGASASSSSDSQSSEAELESEAADSGDKDNDTTVLPPSQQSSSTSFLPKRKKHRQDMYRVFDGSSLMVLGMLVQEHVAKLMRGKVPEGWVEGDESEESEEGRDEDKEDVDSDGGDSEGEGNDEEQEQEQEGSSDEEPTVDESGDDELEKRIALPTACTRESSSN